MHKNILLVVMCSLIVLQQAALSEVQWLQYRTSENAREMFGGSSQFMRIETKEKPTNELLPKASDDNPLFFKWKTSMDEKGFRWVMLDKQHKHGLCDTLYIDSDGNGRLDDEQAYTCSSSEEYENVFSQVGVRFEVEDGPVTYHINFRFYSYNERSTYLYAYSGCWYEGKVVINGEDTRIILVDYNCNGTFDDKSDSFASDRMVIGPDNHSETKYTGNYFEYKDSLWKPVVSKDGAFVEVTSASDVPYAKVSMPKAITKFRAAGVNGMFDRTVKDGVVELPVGKYQIYSWSMSKTDDNGDDWRMDGRLSGGNKKARFEVVQNESVDLDIGEPIYSQLDARKQGESLDFNQELTGRFGESISLYKSNKRSPAPKIHIRDKTGEYNRTFALSYG